MNCLTRQPEFTGRLKPLIVSEEINFSNHEKSDLVARFNQLDPTNEFKGDITKLLGKSCLVTVISPSRYR